MSVVKPEISLKKNVIKRRSPPRSGRLLGGDHALHHAGGEIHAEHLADAAAVAVGGKQTVTKEQSEAEDRGAKRFEHGGDEVDFEKCGRGGDGCDQQRQETSPAPGGGGEDFHGGGDGSDGSDDGGALGQI